MAAKYELPEGFEATPLAMALIADANNGKEVNIDDAIDCVVEYGRARGGFELHEQVDFLHEHPAFMSIPAVRVVGRSPTFASEFSRLLGDDEEVAYFRETVIDDLVRRGDTRPAAEEVVAEAIALAQACVAHVSNYDAELMVLAGFTEVPTTSAVITAIVQR